jgi:hypothetical protein
LHLSVAISKKLISGTEVAEDGSGSSGWRTNSIDFIVFEISVRERGRLGCSIESN